MESKKIKVLEEMLGLELEEQRQLLNFLEQNKKAIAKLEERIKEERAKESTKVQRGLTMRVL